MKSLFPIFLVFSMIFLLTNDSFGYEKEINSVSAEMAEKIAGSGKKTIAVVDFTDLQGNVTELGRFLAEEFSVSLADAGKGFEVVDRTHLRSIIQENKLSETGLIDSTTARKLGKIAGVESLITGTITPFGDSIRLAVKILDTSTAKIIGANRANLAKTGALEDLISTGIVARNPQLKSTKMTTTSSAKTKMKTNETEGGALSSTTKNGIKFDLVSCKRNGKSVVFDLKITSIDKDVKLYLYRRRRSSQKTRFFDNYANEYIPSKVKLANKTSDGSYAIHLAIKGLPTSAEILFENVPENATSAAMLEIGCYDDKYFTVQFRDIPIKM